MTGELGSKILGTSYFVMLCSSIDDAGQDGDVVECACTRRVDTADTRNHVTLPVSLSDLCGVNEHILIDQREKRRISVEYSKGQCFLYCVLQKQ
jgi:hypothetical protein